MPGGPANARVRPNGCGGHGDHTSCANGSVRGTARRAGPERLRRAKPCIGPGQNTIQRARAPLTRDPAMGPAHVLVALLVISASARSMVGNACVSMPLTFFFSFSRSGGCREFLIFGCRLHSVPCWRRHGRRRAVHVAHRQVEKMLSSLGLGAPWRCARGTGPHCVFPLLCRASVTFGDPVSCRPYAAPAPRVDSGVQTTVRLGRSG